ncbi:MAG: GCN5-related N-acetyltransferase [Caulobacter sp.]|nr:GCN5-related N-acetyltransferase [Caulobacter sp.]
MVTGPHPLNRPVWNALKGPQAQYAITRGPALRFEPAIGQFAAIPDTAPESLAALGQLVQDFGEAILFEPADLPPVPGADLTLQAQAVQMIAERQIAPSKPPFEILPLGEADAAEMLALAALTKPGPFFARTHELGRFIGFREGGVLIAMAGERMRAGPFTEVSGVCTLPEHRGKGLAGHLMRHVAGVIQDRGETPFLHAFASNTGAIGLYESLGFLLRAELTVSVLAPA